MGILDFLKKEKKSGNAAKLPPLPDMSSLPPLPDMPGEQVSQEPVPPLPKQDEQSPPEEAAPLFPDIPEEGLPQSDLPEPRPAEVAPEPEMEMPEEKPIQEVPNKIPDLEELPEPPAFKPEAEPEPIFEQLKPISPPRPFGAEPSKPPAVHSGVPEHLPQLEGFKPEPFVPAAQGKLVMKRGATGPLFVRMDEYKTLLEDIEQMKIGFKQNETIYTRLEDYRTDQDKHFEKFHQALEDIQRKLLYMDKTLFETS